jgi:hypothetical protein
VSKKKNNENFNPIFNVYKGLDTEIRFIKEIATSQFKEEMKKIGFRFIAEWIEWGFPILYNDMFLVEKNNYLYRVTFSAGTKQINIGNSTFQRFDTIDESKFYHFKTKSLLGYKISSDNKVQRTDGNKNHPKGGKLTYRDLLRLEKISKLLSEN